MRNKGKKLMNLALRTDQKVDMVTEWLSHDFDHEQAIQSADSGQGKQKYSLLPEWTIYMIWCFEFYGELAQMVERPLSMREVPGSMPGFSI